MDLREALCVAPPRLIYTVLRQKVWVLEVASGMDGKWVKQCLLGKEHRGGLELKGGLCPTLALHLGRSVSATEGWGN